MLNGPPGLRVNVAAENMSAVNAHVAKSKSRCLHAGSVGCQSEVDVYLLCATACPDNPTSKEITKIALDLIMMPPNKDPLNSIPNRQENQ